MSRLVPGARTALLVLTLVLVGGCGDAEPDPEENATLARQEPVPPGALGTLGGRIYLDPAGADAILEAEGLTAETFRARVKEISADPRMAREYAVAFEAEAGAAVEADDAMEEPGG